MVKPHHIYETMGSVSSPRKSSEEHFGVVAMVSHLAERVQETLARAVPLVFLVCGLLWLLVLVVRSSLFPPFFLMTLAGITWGKRVMVSLRERGGPISLLPRWARSLLTETRPLDAMSAMALVVDAQKGIGLCVHFLAALRLDEAERATFVEQLPTRLREFVLAPGLLQLVPQSVRALIAWDEPVGGVLLGPPEEILSDLNVVEEPGDAPRADPSFNDDDASSSSEEEDFALYEEEPSTQSRRRRPSFPQDIGALTNGFIAHSDENLGGPRAAATTRESSSAASSSSDRGSEDDDDTTTNDDNKVAASGAGAVFAHMRENLRNFLRSARRATPIASVRSASSGFLDSLVEVAKAGLLATLRKKTTKRKTKRLRRRQKREAPQSVVRAVAEFNPWPTLLRVVSRRAATWLREQLTVTTLTTTSIAAAAALSAQLALSPASRRVAANSARLGGVIFATTALSTSVAAFCALHANSIVDSVAIARTASFSPRNNPKTERPVKKPHYTTRERSDVGVEDQFFFNHPDDDDDDDDDDEKDDASRRTRDNEDDDDDDESTLSQPSMTAAVLVCSYVVARSCDFRQFYDLLYSPFAEQLSARFVNALMRLRAPFE